MDELIPVIYQCAFCGEDIETLIDPSGGSRQRYTEDCTVCCRPNDLIIIIGQDGNVTLDVDFEG